jgi:hypothetical protein
MDSDRLNKWLTLGANVGVLIGIMLLIAELSQNYEIVRAQTRTELSQSLLDLLALSASNKGLAEITVKATRGEELTDAEMYMLGARNESVFAYWQNVHYQGRNGMYDEDEFSKHIQMMGSVLNQSPNLVRYWCEDRDNYPEIFADEIDQLIPADSCKNQ